MPAVWLPELVQVPAEQGGDRRGVRQDSSGLVVAYGASEEKRAIGPAPVTFEVAKVLGYHNGKVIRMDVGAT